MPLAFWLLLAALTAPAQVPQIPLSPHGAVLRFAVAGDTGDGAGSVAAGIARVHRERALDAIILTGDTFYPCGVTSEHDPRWSLVRPLTSIGVPVFPVLGNHDFCGGSSPTAQIRATGVEPNWHFPARNYSVHGKLADFTLVDTTAFVKGRENLPRIVEQSFAGAEAPWRVVVGHHPVVSSGFHGYFPRAEVKRMNELVPALHESHVDLYICGHDHHLELIRGRTLLLVSGAGSDPIPPLKLRVHTVYPPEIRRERIGFAVVEITEHVIRVRFYGAAGNPLSEWIEGRRK